MSSSSIRSQIKRKQVELSQVEGALAQANTDFGEIEAFYGKIKSTYSSFMASIENRRLRLNKITNLLETVKSANAYRNFAGDMLSGSAFYNAEENYYNLEKTVSEEMSELDDLTVSLRSKIKSLENEISSLQYTYQQALAQEAAERSAKI